MAEGELISKCYKLLEANGESELAAQFRNELEEKAGNRVITVKHGVAAPSDALVRELDGWSDKLREAIPGWEMPDKVMKFKSCTINEVRFETRVVSERNSLVFFSPLQALTSDSGLVPVPGRIMDIFSPYQCQADDDAKDNPKFEGLVFFAIRRYKLVNKEVFNPFTEWINFGADLWSDQLEDQLHIIPHTDMLFHGICRQWEKGVLVIKSLQMVSHPASEYNCTISIMILTRTHRISDVRVAL